MNKTIAVMALTIFASSMQIVGSFNVEEMIQTIQEIKSMNRGECRNYPTDLSDISGRGPCTPGYEYRPQNGRDYLKDVLRNEPEYGGPVDPLGKAHKRYTQTDVSSLYRQHTRYYYELTRDFAQFKERHRLTASEENLIDFAIASKCKPDQIAALTRYASWGSQIASDKLRPLLPSTLTQLVTATSPTLAPKTVARTKKEEYEIALKVLENSKELQDYAVLLAQARKV